MKLFKVLVWGTLICPLLLIGGENLLPQEFDPQENVWIYLAREILNRTDFCLAGGINAHLVFTSCLIAVPTPLKILQNYTMLKDVKKENTYQDIYKWGTIVKEKSRDMFSVRVQATANASECFLIVNCTSNCFKLNQGRKIFCNKTSQISYVYTHTILPRGWFLACGRMIYSYLPANATGGPCTIARVTAALPRKSDLMHTEQTPLGGRFKRAYTTLTADCDENDSPGLLSKAEYIALAASIVGVLGLAVSNNRNLNAVACVLAKGLNATSRALSALNAEQKQLRDAVLENRAAIDYLLLRHNLGCETLKGMCCFNLTDNSVLIEDKIGALQRLTQTLKETSGLDFSWLTSWLPNFGWLKQLFCMVILFCFIGIMICFRIHCIPVCIASIFRPKVNQMILQKKKAENTRFVLSQIEWSNHN
ncbi:syncytin-A-like [Alligator mississippiensis]|uniref:syncytin-A-like n=1 Tax=Alligator mississippiensis TaxID=8496 RepID=UPI002877A7C3|nr:syncytin-A-like [Alligator mississippiensis]XP_059580915.1 syncytin-A-like [Alligator mississippiensis]XP_059580916.1 syncytin-A-like [Alligator mississippiensis]